MMNNMEPDDAPLLANEEGATGQQQQSHHEDSAHNSNINDSNPYGIYPLLVSEDCEKQVPHVTTLLFGGTIKQVFWQFRLSLGVILANLVSMIFVAVLLHLPAEYVLSRGGDDGGDPWANFQYKALISIGLAMSLFTYLIDMILCRQGAQSVEEMVKNRQDNGSTATDTSTTHRGQSFLDSEPSEQQQQQQSTQQPAVIDIVELSRKVDTSFGYNQQNTVQNRQPQATFIVCLLYALYSVAAFRVATNATSLFYMHFMVPNSELALKGRCLVGGHFDHFSDDYDDQSVASLQTLPEFASLPADVQKWVRRQNNDGRMYYEQDSLSWFNRSLPYLTMGDGTLVFAKATGFNRKYYGYNQLKASDKDKPGIVVHSPRSSKMKEYLRTEQSVPHYWFSNDMAIELFGFPSNPPYFGWCGIFSNDEVETIQEELLCYNSKRKTSPFHRFPAVYDFDKTINGGGGGPSTLYATDDTVWTASAKQIYRQARGLVGSSRTTRILLTSHNIITMERQLVMSKNATHEESQGRRPSFVNTKCKVFDWLHLVVSLVVLSFISFQLYRLDVPSCAVPVTAALTLALNALLDAAWAGLMLLGLACACLYQLVAPQRGKMLRRYVSTEILIWTLYALQIAASWDFWAQSWSADYWDDFDIFDSYVSIPLLAFLVSTATALLLNHPVFQILAVCFSSIGFMSFLCVFAGLNYLLVPVVLLSLSLGCYRAGSLMQMYRVHVIVYVGRFCRACRNLCKKYGNLR